VELENQIRLSFKDIEMIPRLQKELEAVQVEHRRS
jgi:hypothetical protein